MHLNGVFKALGGDFDAFADVFAKAMEKDSETALKLFIAMCKSVADVAYANDEKKRILDTIYLIKLIFDK